MSEKMNDLIKGFNINSAGYGMIPKLVMQDRNLHAMAKAIYAYFCSYTGAGDTCFPSRKKICYDLNISSDTFTKHLKNLVSAGYVKVEQIKENGRFSYNLYTLNDTILPCPKISDTEKTGSGKLVTKSNSIKNNKENKNNIKKERKIIKERNDEKLENKKQDTENLYLEKKETMKSFNDLIDSYTTNQQLRAELKEHLKVRKTKKALKNHALELSLKELNRIASSDEEKIAIVQNSIIGGWTKFYELKPDEKKRLKDKPSYNLDDYEDYDIFS